MRYLAGDAAGLAAVSIRTRHFCRVMHRQIFVVTAGGGVSIRTRHFCRVMLAMFPGEGVGAEFQSAPGISAG